MSAKTQDTYRTASTETPLCSSGRHSLAESKLDGYRMLYQWLGPGPPDGGNSSSKTSKKEGYRTSSFELFVFLPLAEGEGGRGLLNAEKR